MHFEGDFIYDNGDEVIILRGEFEGQHATVVKETYCHDDYILKLKDGTEVILSCDSFDLAEDYI